MPIELVIALTFIGVIALIRTVLFRGSRRDR